MPIDTSIYQNSGSLANSINTGVSIGQMLKQNDIQNAKAEKTKALNDIIKKNLVTDQNGNISLGKDALPETYKLDYQSGIDLDNHLKNKNIEDLAYDAKVSKSIFSNMNQDNYQQIKEQAIKMGLKNAEMLPNIYSDDLRARGLMASIDAEKQIANRMEQEKRASDNAFRDQKFNNENSQFDRTYTQRDKEFDVRMAEARAEKNAKQQEIKAEKTQELETPYGLANTKDDAKQLKEAHESKLSFDNKIQQMIDLREKHGGGAILNREDVARAKQLSKDALLEYKNMAKLGVLSKSDEDIVNAIIPADPLAFTASGLIGQDPILNNLKSFKEDASKDFASRVQTRTRSGMDEFKKQGYLKPEDTAKSPVSISAHPQIDQAFEWAKQNPSDPRAAEIMKRIGK